MPIINIRKLRLAASAALVLGSCIHAAAIPARHGVVSLTQPDGTEVPALMHGDEYHHFYTTPGGRPLEKDARGYYIEQNVEAAAFFELQADISRRSLRRLAASTMMKAPSKAPRNIGLVPGASFPVTGSPRALVILVEYSDVHFTHPDPADYFGRMINQPGFSDWGGTGSALDFFTENSCGAFTPQFDILGPVTLPKEQAYYGANDSRGDDRLAYMMVVDAVRLLDDQVDFSVYDNDGDGEVDNVFVFYAGEGESSSGVADQVWPHTFFIKYGSSVTVRHDGVNFNRYACSNEWNYPRDKYGKLIPGETGRPDGVGTFVHEFSHVMGLPDLYSITYNKAFTPGAWSTLDYGPYNNDGCTPPNYSVYERYALGWLEPRVITSAANVRLEEISRNKAAMIPTLKDTEFFLFENRQQTGWDAYIPGHGMLVWHVDYDANVWNNNTVNTDINHQYVDIEEADGMGTDETRADDAFPGGLERTDFNDTTIPNMLTWGGRSLGLPVSNIAESAEGVITFKVAGGRPDVGIPTALEATDVTPGGFTARWTASTESDCTYALTVFTRTGAGNRGIAVVPAYDALNVGSVTEHAVTGLQTDTQYYYYVSTVVAAGESEPSEEIAVRTLPPTFDYLAPEVLEAAEITHNSFTARWKALADATEYYLTVLTPTEAGAIEDACDFTGGLAELPQGWSTTSTTTYAIASNCGQAKPSLRMTQSGQVVATPLFDDDISALSFWCRGVSTKTGDKITVQASADGVEWADIAQIELTTASGGKVCTVDAIPAGTRAIRLVAAQSAGSVAVDDITVSHGTAYTDTPLVGYDALPVGNVTEYKVSGLEESRQYSYYVHATNGTLTSLPSGRHILTTSTSAGISIPDVSAVNVAVEGSVVTVLGLEHGNATLYNTMGQAVASAKTLGGRAVLTAPQGGVYVLVAENQTIAKIIIR